jgi:hypothetical protein
MREAPPKGRVSKELVIRHLPLMIITLLMQLETLKEWVKSHNTVGSVDDHESLGVIGGMPCR